MKAIEKFISDWNTQNETLFFIPKVSPKKPSKIIIRFAPDSRPTKIKDPWDKLIIGVETKSRGILSVSTNEVMYNWGIVELKIGKQDSIAEEETIIETLEWIGRSFLK